MGTFLAWLTGIVAIIGIKWGTYKYSPGNKRKIRFMCNILITILIIGGCLYAIYYTSNYLKNVNERKINAEKEYLECYNDILFEIKSKNYKIAEKKIDSLLLHVENEEEYVNTVILKGTCYFNDAIDTTDYVYQSYCYENAILALQDLQSGNMKLSSDQSVSVNLMLGYTYLFWDDQMYMKDIDINGIVDYFEKEIDRNTSVSCSDVFGFLRLFYEKRFIRDSRKEDLQKAILYCERAIDEGERESNNTIFTREMSKLYEMKMAYYYFRSAIFDMLEKRDPSDSFRKSISIYNDVISKCNIQSDRDIYCESSKDLGRCYYMLSLIDGKNKELYAEKAYDSFKKFIYMDEEYLDSAMEGCYVFVNLNVTEEQIEILLKRYKRLLQKYDELFDYKNAALTRFELANSYYFLSNKFVSEDYYIKGKKILEEICEKYYDYLPISRKEGVESLKKQYEALEKVLYGIN